MRTTINISRFFTEGWWQYFLRFYHTSISAALARLNSYRYTMKKNSFTETNSINGNPKKLEEKSKPDDGLIELEGGFTMYPSEILDFSGGADSFL